LASSVFVILVAVFCSFLKNEVKAQQPYSSTLVINAAAGDPDAQVALSQCYLLGEGVEKNTNEAIRLLRLAAEKNNSGALCILATMFLNGEYVQQDPILAEKYLLKGANNGYPIAQMLLGDFYYQGFKNQKYYIPPDKQKSEKWFKEAEKQGLFSKKRVDTKETSTPEGAHVLTFDPRTAEADTKKTEEYYEKEKEKIISDGVKDMQNGLNKAVDKIATEAENLKKQATESEKRIIKEETDKTTNPQQNP
jgi:TPR repeat protein